jgi:hypothetical protein
MNRISVTPEVTPPLLWAPPCWTLLSSVRACKIRQLTPVMSMDSGPVV